MSEVIDHLSAVPLFRGLPESAMEAVAGLASETHFADGDTVTREGDEGDAFLVVVDGRLRNGMFVATPGSMVTKCPSKYSAAKPSSE